MAASRRPGLLLLPLEAHGGRRRGLFRLLVIADDAFQRAQGDDGAFLATGHEGDGTQGHGVTPFAG